MNRTDFSVNEFNRTMQEDVSLQNLNFCKAVVLSNKKLSITVRHDPARLCGEYAVLASDLSVEYSADFDNFYYGVSPGVDSFMIVDAISALAFRSTETLEAFISLHRKHFMLHREQASCLPAVAKLILLTIASKYGIVLRLSEELRPLVAAKESFPEIVAVNEAAGTVALHGCPTDELLDFMKDLRFVRGDGAWESDVSGIPLRDVYADKGNIRLLVGKVFYSGVLLKPIELVRQNSNQENNISNYQMVYERSTFAAVCAFDDHRIAHPLLAPCAETLRELFREDDRLKLELNDRLSDESISDGERIACVNRYIRSCFNVNQIGISSNVKTADGKIFFGLRGSGNIDNGCLYPGINGNAEVYDENVSFYNNSIYEDLPTIRVSDARCDLLGEIEREAYGELRLLTKRESWECYGVILAGNLPRAGAGSPGNRRCHFNVLFENESEDTLEKIVERKAKASEAFENQSFAGIRIRYYENRLHRLLGGAAGFFRGILDSKDFFESVLILLLAFAGAKAVDLSGDDPSSVFSTAFAVLILLSNVIQIIKLTAKWLKSARTTKTIHIYGNMSYDELSKTISKALRNQYHPAAYASLKMHIENVVYNRRRKD